MPGAHREPFRAMLSALERLASRRQQVRAGVSAFLSEHRPVTMKVEPRVQTIRIEG